MKKFSNKGFTLIELLVVIAIIGILASIVLVSLNSARQKGKDSRILSDVNQVRNQIESEQNSSGTYPSSGTSCVTAADTVNASSGNCHTLALDAGNSGGALTVKTDTVTAQNIYTKYSVYSVLASDTTKYYCVDSSGKAETTSTDPAGTDPVCP
jgi:prepilin-type N-terminal cleavage/methylation domain-containing protein